MESKNEETYNNETGGMFCKVNDIGLWNIIRL